MMLLLRHLGDIAMRTKDGIRLSSVAQWCRMVGLDYNRLLLENHAEDSEIEVKSVTEQEANRNDTEALPLFISPLESQACAMCRHTMIPSADGKTLTVQVSY